MGTQLDRIKEAEEKQGARVIIDRTSSMTVGQVEAFFKEAMRLFVEESHHYSVNGGGALTGVVRGVVHNWHSDGPNIDSITARALEKVIGR